MLKDFILGGQDGIVNVLGITLGMAGATQDARIVIIAGLAALFAESISMAAVAYTSTKAEHDFYYGELGKEKRRLKIQPSLEKKEIEQVYYQKGFRGRLLKQIVQKITSDDKMWLDTLMRESNMVHNGYSPLKSAFVVGCASTLGSLIPVLPFFFLTLAHALVFSVVISALSLFLAGAFEGKITLRSWFNEGFKLMVIGLLAAFIGFMIGKWLGVNVV